VRLCGHPVGLVAQTIFRQNLSFGEHLEGVLFFFRLFLTGLATLDRAVRSHTHHISMLPISLSIPASPSIDSEKAGSLAFKKHATMAGIPPKEKNGAFVSMLKFQELNTQPPSPN